MKNFETKIVAPKTVYRSAFIYTFLDETYPAGHLGEDSVFVIVKVPKHLAAIYISELNKISDLYTLLKK